MTLSFAPCFLQPISWTFFSGSQTEPCFQNMNHRCRLTGRVYLFTLNFFTGISQLLFFCCCICFSLACLIYTFSLSFSSSFVFQTDKFTSSYICNSNDKWNDILNDWMLSVQTPFRCISKEIWAKDTSHFK